MLLNPQILLEPRRSVIATSTYVGPGDIIVSGWDVWGGLRGFSAAYSTGSNPAIDIMDQSNANPLTVNILSTGLLNVAAVATWVAAHSVTTIKISKIYDQSGNGKHFDNVGTNIYPVLTLNDNGALPCITSSRASFPWPDLATTANSADITNPFSVVCVAMRNTSTAIEQVITSNGQVSVSFSATLDFVKINNGPSNVAAAATDGLTHHIGGVFYFSTNSSICVDGGTPVTSNIAAFSTNANPWHFPNAGLSGKTWEAGWCSGDISSNFTALSTNAHTAWNF